MEIEEEEVKWEAMEPEKDEPVLTLGLRRRRAPEQSLHSLLPSSISLLAESLSYINLVSLKFFQKLTCSGSFSYEAHVRGESENKIEESQALAPAYAGLCQPPPLDAVV